MKPHKHAELIKAWADGADVQYRWKHWHANEWEEWRDLIFLGDFNDAINFEYRLKPEPKPDVVMYSRVLSVQEHKDGGYYAWVSNAYTEMPSCKADNLKLTFDGETGNLKSAEVLK